VKRWTFPYRFSGEGGCPEGVRCVTTGWREGGGGIEAWREREKQGGRERADYGGGALHGGTLWWERVWKGAKG
jgi:hypothetical protein